MAINQGSIAKEAPMPDSATTQNSEFVLTISSNARVHVCPMYSWARRQLRRQERRPLNLLDWRCSVMYYDDMNSASAIAFYDSSANQIPTLTLGTTTDSGQRSHLSHVDFRLLELQNSAEIISSQHSFFKERPYVVAFLAYGTTQSIPISQMAIGSNHSVIP